VLQRPPRNPKTCVQFTCWICPRLHKKF